MNPTAKILGLAQIQKYLAMTIPQFKKGLEETMHILARRIVNDVKSNYVNGRSSANEPRLNVRSGELKKSIDYKVVQIRSGVFTASIGSPKKYARFNHDGAIIPPHKIYPKRKKALAWLPTGNIVNRIQAEGVRAFSKNKNNFKRKGGLSARGRDTAIQAGLLTVRKWVQHPGAIIPARPFLQASLQKNKNLIIDKLFIDLSAILKRGK